MRRYFTHQWNRFPIIVHKLDSTFNTFQNKSRTLRLFLVNSTSEEKSAFAISSITSIPNSILLGNALCTKSVKVLLGKPLNYLLEISDKGTVLLMSLRNIPVLIDVNLIAFPFVLIKTGNSILEIDPFLFIQAVNGKLYRLTKPYV